MFYFKEFYKELGTKVRMRRISSSSRVFAPQTRKSRRIYSGSLKAIEWKWIKKRKRRRLWNYFLYYVTVNHRFPLHLSSSPGSAVSTFNLYVSPILIFHSFRSTCSEHAKHGCLSVSKLFLHLVSWINYSKFHNVQWAGFDDKDEEHRPWLRVWDVNLIMQNQYLQWWTLFSDAIGLI